MWFQVVLYLPLWSARVIAIAYIEFCEDACARTAEQSYGLEIFPELF